MAEAAATTDGRRTRSRVIFVEEPLPSAGHSRLELKSREENVVVVVPHLSTELSPAQANTELERLPEIQLEQLEIDRYVLWPARKEGRAASLTAVECLEERACGSYREFVGELEYVLIA